MGICTDRLSALPDELLCDIKSRLPFKEAVSTALLSKRWRFLPLDLLNLVFNETDFAPASGPSASSKKQRRAFLKFVLCWIKRSSKDDEEEAKNKHNSSSKERKLSLTFPRPEEHFTLVKCVLERVINKKLDVVDIDFSNPSWDEDDFENCRPDTLMHIPRIRGAPFKDVQYLKLSSCDVPVISMHSDSGFLRLKSVTLEWLTLEMGSEILTDFLGMCPVLESLFLRRCTLEEYVKIESESLKSLIMEKCCSDDNETSPVVDIDTPELNVLKYHSGVLVIFSFKSSRINPDLEASLDFGLQKQYDFAQVYAHKLWLGLNELNVVKTLTVCTYVLQAISHGEEEPMELNLTYPLKLNHLILKASLIEEELYGITFFLQNCPDLEVLTIDLNSITPNVVFPVSYYHPFLSLFFFFSFLGYN
ncbi:OLC1v1022791C2 [Oldenlandia corymbosa var. corymbosa]|uniref:OLC1v1022791C2 n=1 Tax=Oldenlandia corymbosa var. corymbosa TaxID=529605 RepID=A0AAV1BYL3_OLDCO|nr:OLC1v1022791C2 [Oldenlandia corymbosa var. corymbosa]